MHAYFAFVLVKVLWAGAIYNMSGDGRQVSPPVAQAVSTVEPSEAQCQADGAKWYAAAIEAAQHGKADAVEPNALTYDCVVEALGGEDA